MRSAQARATKDALVKAARHLFASQGYGSVPIEKIARSAGVSVQTFYATFGSKRSILLALLDDMEADAGLEDLKKEFNVFEQDPRKQLEVLVAFAVRIYVRGGDILEIARGAGAHDPDLRQLWKNGEGRRRKVVKRLVGAWAIQRVLRLELTQALATDIAWALLGADLYRLLVVECRWPAARFQAWLEASLQQQLFPVRF